MSWVACADVRRNLCSALGFPTEFFPVLFAIPRMAGYLAHWKESLDDPDTKILRPQQVLETYPRPGAICSPVLY